MPTPTRSFGGDGPLPVAVLSPLASRLVDTPVVTTIHGFSSPKILAVYERYDPTTTRTTP